MTEIEKAVRSGDPDAVSRWVAEQVEQGRPKADVMRDLTRAMQALPPPPDEIPAEQIQHWIDEMISSGKAEYFQDCAAALGVHRTSLTRFRKEGGPKMLALACAALLAGVKPYGGGR
jgi:uncharacterized Zn finger protein